ncbi:P-loop containing nucleoside triphosphate hydrolase protein, partial [Gloeopeniophorella convolvens]
MPDVPSLEDIQAKTRDRFSCNPCSWQVKAVQEILKNDHDVICIAGTGSGKTLTFWMPLLFRQAGIQIVVMPLNILGQQNVDQLNAAGFRAISLKAGEASFENFRDIAEGMYQVIVVNPEILMQEKGGFERLWKDPSFTSQVISIIFDEAHCISTWGDFRPEYRQVGRLRYLLPRCIPFYIVSATLPDVILADIVETLHIDRGRAAFIRLSNDHPNVCLAVRKMEFANASFEDLAFLIKPGWRQGDDPPPKFLIFFNRISESVAAARMLQCRLPLGYRKHIRWFNADMSPQFREDEVAAFRDGSTWGLCCTD